MPTQRSKYPWGASPRRARRRGIPSPPSAREVAKPKVLPEGEKKGRRADVGIRPYTRSIDGRFVGGDAYIAPPRPQARNSKASLCEGGGAKRRRERYAAAAPWHRPKGAFRAPARGTFALGGKSTQKRRQKLRFWISLRAFTRRLSRLICHANAVPCKFHLNVASPLLLFSLPLLL